MGLFKEIAEPLIARRVPVIPLRPRTKIAFLNGWETQATLDPTKIAEWDQENADYNGACVAYAKPDGVWFFEIDQAGFAAQIEQQTGHKLPETFMVRSSPGRGHFYFKQTPASIAMGNQQGKDDNGKEAWSARVDNRYVVAPGSYHPTSGLRYETLRNCDLVEAPQWLIDWCVRNNKSTKTGHAELDSQTDIIEGNRNNALTSILGKARQVLNMDREQLFNYGLSVNSERCKPPLPETEVRQIANSIATYAVKEPSKVLIGGKEVGAEPAVASQEAVPTEALEIPAVPYPTFPRWVMEGTSLYDGFIKPICAVNSRFPEFMFMPAITILLNYLALKVEIANKRIIPSFWMVSIGRKGRVIKSTSVNDALEYLETCGIAAQGGGGTRNAEGRSLIWSVGSTEGLGMEMTRTNCKNAILFYDELGTLGAKAGIENSSMKKHLLTMYESGQFSNTVKSRKENFDFAPRSYCTSLIACTTDKNFRSIWAKIGGSDDGMDDRFFFLYQPEILDELKPYTYVNTIMGTERTKQYITKALDKRVYNIADETVLENIIGEVGNRAEHRIEKLALYFAIDMGRDEIDESCVERAVAIVRYERAVKKYLKAFEATTFEGTLQNEIIQLLQRNGGSIAVRDLNRNMHPERHGTSLWFKVYSGLIKAGWTVESGTGKKGDPVILVLLRMPETDEE